MTTNLPPTWQTQYWPTMTPDLQQQLEQILQLMESGRVSDARNQLYEILNPQNFDLSA